VHFVVADFVLAAVILLSNQFLGYMKYWKTIHGMHVKFCGLQNGFEGDPWNADLASSVAVSDCDINIPVSVYVVTVFKVKEL
jgi:hypothetical protein